MARKNIYINALEKIMRDDTPAPPTTRTRAEVERDIAEISEMLKGPMTNDERLCLVADRQHLRKQLAALGPAS